VLPALAVMLGAVLPLVSGARTLFLRDVLNLHFPLKVAQVEAWKAGELPLIDVGRAGGQALLANPNAVTLYPDNFLYAVAPVLWAFNAHFWLHLLLAPFCMFWLARRLGLSAGASWLAGVSYACSGYFLSHLNFYNLIAGVALAPALCAAVLRALDLCSVPDSRLFRPWIPVAFLVALLMFAGDPILLVLSLGAAVVLGGERWRSTRAGVTSESAPGSLLQAPWVCFGGALLVAALLSAVQWVPFLETLGLSFRGHQGYGEAGALAASWDPRSALGWIVPLAFGHPNLGFWGQDYFGGDLPLYFSLYPGAIALVLVCFSGRPGSGAGLPRLRLVAWVLIVAGLFFALGDMNPLVRLLTRLPGSGLLRFPIKAWLWVALGASCLVGCGAERAFLERDLRGLARTSGLVVLLFIGLCAAVLQFDVGFSSWLSGLGAESRVGEIRPRWIGLSFLGALVACVPWLTARWIKGLGAAAVLAFVHVLTQLVLLSPLFEADEVAAYKTEPQALQYTEPDERLVQGGVFDLFGSHSAQVEFPSRSLRWVQRRGWNELYPFAGVRFGRRYDLNVSPEGLDAFLTQMTAQALRSIDDLSRIRVLEAMGSDVLILDRPLNAQAADRVVLRGQVENFGAQSFIYELKSVPDVQVLGQILRAPHLNATLQAMISPDFDPSVSVVVPGASSQIVVESGAGGEVLSVREVGDGLDIRVRAAGPSVVLVQRSHLGQYRATVDGQSVPLVAGNLSRMALEVGPGEHEVRIWVSRRSVGLGAAAGVLGLVICWFLGRLKPRSGGAG